MRVARLAMAAALCLSLLAGACGGDPPVPRQAANVPDGLVPNTIQGDTLAFYESTVPGVREAFSNAGKESLAADGRLWELRKGDRLVGALQLSTLLPDVDLTRPERRREIVRQVLPAIVDELTVGEVRVWTASSYDKTVYLWFASDMFALLSLKASDDDLDREAVLNEVVTFAASSDGWKPLFIDDEFGEDI